MFIFGIKLDCHNIYNFSAQLKIRDFETGMAWTKEDCSNILSKSVIREIITSTHVTMLLYSGGMVREVFVWAADTMIVGAVKKASGNCKV